MAGYRANLGGLFGGGSGPSAPRVLDIGGAIDAATHGATTLIQNAYMRKHAAAQMDLERQKVEQENAYRQQELEVQRERNRATASGNGIVPGGTTISRQPDPTPPSPIASTFAGAMQAQGGLSPVAPADPLMQPVTQGSLGSVPHLNVTTTPDHYEAAADPRLTRGLGFIGARGDNQMTIEEMREQARQEAAAAAQEARAREGDKNRSTRIKVAGMHPSGTGEAPAVAGTRRDLKDTTTQQIRAENQVKALKSEQRALLNDHPRANRPLSEQRTAADSSLARQYTGNVNAIGTAQQRAARLTQSADSTLGVLHQKRAHGPSAGDDPAPFDAHAFDQSITDDELHDAMQNGATDEASVRAHVLAKRSAQ